MAANSLDDAFAAVKKEMPSWQTVSFDLSDNPDKPITATVTDAGRGRPDRWVKLTLDRDTAKITAREGFDKNTPGVRLRQWVRWIHTGKAGGIGEILAVVRRVAV